jgi:hypothetical protein
MNPLTGLFTWRVASKTCANLMPHRTVDSFVTGNESVILQALAGIGDASVHSGCPNLRIEADFLPRIH